MRIRCCDHDCFMNIVCFLNYPRNISGYILCTNEHQEKRMVGEMFCIQRSNYLRTRVYEYTWCKSKSTLPLSHSGEYVDGLECFSCRF